MTYMFLGDDSSWFQIPKEKRWTKHVQNKILKLFDPPNSDGDNTSGANSSPKGAGTADQSSSKLKSSPTIFGLKGKGMTPLWPIDIGEETTLKKVHEVYTKPSKKVTVIGMKPT